MDSDGEGKRQRGFTGRKESLFSDDSYVAKTGHLPPTRDSRKYRSQYYSLPTFEVEVKVPLLLRINVYPYKEESVYKY